MSTAITKICYSAVYQPTNPPAPTQHGKHKFINQLKISFQKLFTPAYSTFFPKENLMFEDTDERMLISPSPSTRRRLLEKLETYRSAVVDFRHKQPTFGRHQNPPAFHWLYLKVYNIMRELSCDPKILLYDLCV